MQKFSVLFLVDNLINGKNIKFFSFNIIFTVFQESIDTNDIIITFFGWCKNHLNFSTNQYESCAVKLINIKWLYKFYFEETDIINNDTVISYMYTYFIIILYKQHDNQFRFQIQGNWDLSVLHWVSFLNCTLTPLGSAPVDLSRVAHACVYVYACVCSSSSSFLLCVL